MSTCRRPTADVVREMLASVGPPQLRRAFYQGLQNPLWVAELAQQGAFANPLPPVRDEAGYIRDEPWPEIDYLNAMADLVPEEVVNVATTLTASENAWVRRGIVEIAAKVPPDQAARLARTLVDWAPDALGARTDPRDLAQVAENLLRGGQTKLGVSLANALYHPREAAQEGRFRSDPKVALESYWYEESLPRIVEAFGDDRLIRVLPWLEDYQAFSGAVKKEPESDLSSFGRPRISARSSRAGDIEHALIDAVRDAAIERIVREPVDTIARLQRSGQALSKKIALHAAATALQQGREAGDDVSALVDAVAEFPSAVEFTRREFLPEFAELLRQLVLVAGEDSISGLGAAMSEGPLGSRAELIERLRVDQTPEEIEAEADGYIAGWQHRLLSAVGAPSLPQGLRDRLAELNRERGVVEDPEASDLEVVSWVGPMSPIDQTEMAQMTGDALLVHLESWHPDPVQWRGPSHEGQGRGLTAVLATRPDFLPADVDRIVGLRPTYLRSVVRGWTEARKADLELPWEVVVSVVERAVALQDASSFQREGDDFDDDGSYVNAKSAVLDLIESLIVKREGMADTPAGVIDRVAPILIAMTEDPALRIEYEGEASDSFDPLTLSLNRRLPTAIRALTKLASWDGFGGLDGAAVMALNDHLPVSDTHGAIAAVFGEALSRLYNSSLPWLEANADVIFGTETGQTVQQEIAFSTALATQHSHSQLLDFLRGPIKGALEREGQLAVGWDGMRSPEQLVGDWIITTYNTGGIESDDPLLDLFFTKATAETRGDVLGHVGWSLMHATRVDEEVRLRVEGIWDARVAHVREHPEDSEELRDFYWYVRSGKFEMAWWLPRLQEAAELLPALNTHGMIGEQIADASKSDPATALDVVERLITHGDDVDDKFGGYDLLERAIPQTLASALDSGEADLATRASRLMDSLGARGYINLDARVQALREAGS